MNRELLCLLATDYHTSKAKLTDRRRNFPFPLRPVCLGAFLLDFLCIYTRDPYNCGCRFSTFVSSRSHERPPFVINAVVSMGALAR